MSFGRAGKARIVLWVRKGCCPLVCAAFAFLVSWVSIAFGRASAVLVGRLMLNLLETGTACNNQSCKAWFSNRLNWHVNYAEQHPTLLGNLLQLTHSNLCSAQPRGYVGLCAGSLCHWRLPVSHSLICYSLAAWTYFNSGWRSNLQFSRKPSCVLPFINKDCTKKWVLEHVLLPVLGVASAEGRSVGRWMGMAALFSCEKMWWISRNISQKIFIFF